MTWKDSERVLSIPIGLAGEEGADVLGLKPGGTFHISCNIFSPEGVSATGDEMERERERERERQRELGRKREMESGKEREREGGIDKDFLNFFTVVPTVI